MHQTMCGLLFLYAVGFTTKYALDSQENRGSENLKTALFSPQYLSEKQCLILFK